MLLRLFTTMVIFVGLGACAMIDAINGSGSSDDAGHVGGADAPSDGGGDSDGGLEEFPLRFHGDFPAGAKPVGLAVGNHPDPGNVWIAVVNETGNQVSMLWRDTEKPGDLLFHEALAVGSEPIAAVMTDFSGDGLDDIAVACRGSQEVYVFFQTGGVPAFTAPVVLPTDQATLAIAAGDFNGDDATDVVISGAAGLGPTAFMRGSEPTSFGPAVVLDGYPSGSAIVAADVDGDGRDDIAGGEGMFVVFFQDTPSYVVEDIGPLSIRAIAATVLAPASSNALIVADPDGLRVWQRDEIDHRRLIEQGMLSAAPGITAIAVGQFSTGDAYTDVVTVGGQIRLCMRDSASVSPTAVYTLPGSTTRSAVAVVDVDGDARDDIIVANPDLATVSVFLNDR